MGCSDGGPPETYSEKDLSSVLDALSELEAVIGENSVRHVWNALPHDLKMDFAWAKWTYHAREKK